MRKLLATVAMAVAGTVGLAAPASAATGHQHFLIVQRNNQVGTVTATGPITGSGRNFEAQNANFGVFVFPGGTVEAVHPETSDHFSFNPKTCVGTVRFTGTYRLRHGTGIYSGVSGSGTYSGTGTFISQHTATGCSQQTTSSVVVINADGTTTLP